MLNKIKNWIQNYYRDAFVDRENAMRFFRVEYGKNAEAAYRYWQIHRKLLNYPS